MAKAAAKANFASILDQSPDDVQKPPKLPVGTYLTQIVALPREDKSAKKQTPFLEFTHKIISAMDDVDEDQLKDFGPLKDKQMKNTYYLTEGSAWRLKEFLEHCGCEGESLRAMAEDVVGKQVLITIMHEPNQDGTDVFARIKSTAPAE